MQNSNSNFSEFPSGEAKILLSGPAGQIETLTSEPTKDIKNTVGVICHPHSLFGGTMHNKVVYTIARALKDLGLRTVRFNFRGVGDSAGSYGAGVGEAEDLLAILNWVQQVRPEDKICLAGFSFGAYVSARVASEISVAQLISVGPAVESFDFTKIKMPTCPWLVIQGEKDEIVSPQAVYAWQARTTPQPELIRIAGAGHFFHGQLVELRQVIVTALQDKF